MDPTISYLTSKYYDACERSVHLSYDCYKSGLPFLPPQIYHKMHQYNFKHGRDSKFSTTDSPFPPLLTDPCNHLNVRNIELNHTISTPLFQHPAPSLISLASTQTYPPPLLNNITSRNLLSNCNSWVQIILLTVPPTQTWTVLIPPPSN